MKRQIRTEAGAVRSKSSATRISKGTGHTTGERYLAELAEHSFLNLWCYPNPYRDLWSTPVLAPMIGPAPPPTSALRR